MTIVVNRDQIERTIGPSQAIDLLETALSHEAAGATTVSPKFITELGGAGAIRILVAVDTAAGYFATKAYHEIVGIGVRFVVTLYSLANGEPLAILDGRPITDLRTGAASGVAARHMGLSGPVNLGIVGSGHQAKAQLTSLSAVLDIASVAVFSPTKSNRDGFAAEMSARYGIPVAAVDSVAAAVDGRQVVATASTARSGEPLLRAEWLDACRLLCAVGNTRPQFAEVDPPTFARAAQVIVDTRHALDEAGDLIFARHAGALDPEAAATLADVVSGSTPIATDGLVIFKSVGTALQDLALAQQVYKTLRDSDNVPDVEICRI